MTSRATLRWRFRHQSNCKPTKTSLPQSNQNPPLARTIDLGIKKIEGRLELLERDGDAVRSALTNL